MPQVTDSIVLNKPIMLLNTYAGPVVFEDEASHTSITWEPAGSNTGGDVQVVPASSLNNIQLLNVLNKGILEVLEAPQEIKEMIEEQLKSAQLVRQRQAYRAQTAESAQTVTDSVERTANRDFVVVTCIGPGVRPGTKCGAELSVRDLNKEDKPPLCNAHKDLANQFVPEIGDNVDGRQVTEWALVQPVR